jgi:hypothetical protein
MTMTTVAAATTLTVLLPVVVVAEATPHYSSRNSVEVAAGTMAPSFLLDDDAAAAAAAATVMGALLPLWSLQADDIERRKESAPEMGKVSQGGRKTGRPSEIRYEERYERRGKEKTEHICRSPPYTNTACENRGYNEGVLLWICMHSSRRRHRL